MASFHKNFISHDLLMRNKRKHHRRKKTRRRKRKTQRRKKQRGGLRFKISNEQLENWKRKPGHDKDCVPCTLDFLGLKDPCVRRLIATSFETGVPPKDIINLLAIEFPDAEIPELNAPDVSEKMTVYNEKKLFISKHTKTSCLYNRTRYRNNKKKYEKIK